jgi:hypothetical protein
MSKPRSLRRSGELLPERAVLGDDARARLERVEPLLDPAAGLEVHELAGDVHPRDLEVVLALPVGQSAVEQLAGLRVHQVGGERARVPAEERVGERDVAPEEADHVQPHEQHREGVDEARRGVGPQLLREERPVGERELEVPRDEHRLERVAVLVGAVHDHRDGLHARDLEPLQRPQHVVLAAGHLVGRLLDGDDVAGEVREAHEVPGDALREGRDRRGGPLVERQLPRQVEERGIDRRRGDVQGSGHAATLPDPGNAAAAAPGAPGGGARGPRQRWWTGSISPRRPAR